MSLSANWQLQVDPQVYKNLKRIPKREVNRILDAINALSSNPYSGDIQKMAGEKNVWRKRVGEYRLFFEISISEKTIDVFWVERRTSKTY